MLLSSPRLKLKWSGRAMNFLEVWHLSRSEIFSIAECYPRDFKRLRRFVILLALRRELLRLANELRALQADLEVTGANTVFHSAFCPYGSCCTGVNSAVLPGHYRS